MTTTSLHAPKGSYLPRLVAAAELITARLPEREFILEPILAQKSLALLYSPRGVGKTFVALGIAWAAAQGGAFLGWRAPRPRRVVYVDGEMAATEMQARLKLLGSAPAGLHFLMADLNITGLPDLGAWPTQRELWEHLGVLPELLVLDNISSLADDPDRWIDMQHWLMALRRLGVAVLLVHHANKEGEQRGTSRREDLLDIVIALRRPADYEPREGARFEIHFEKARGLAGAAVDPVEARLRIDNIGVARWDWRPIRLGELDRVAALLGNGMNPAQVAGELGLSRTKAYLLARTAREKGLVKG